MVVANTGIGRVGICFVAGQLCYASCMAGLVVQHRLDGGQHLVALHFYAHLRRFASMVGCLCRAAVGWIIVTLLHLGFNAF